MLKFNEYREKQRDYGQGLHFAGGSTTEPSDPDDGGTTVEPGEGQISFTIDDVTYLADKDMTFGEWVDSEYNTAGFIATTSEIRNAAGKSVLNAVGGFIRPTTTIDTSSIYKLSE